MRSNGIKSLDWQSFRSFYYTISLLIHLVAETEIINILYGTAQFPGERLTGHSIIIINYRLTVFFASLYISVTITLVAVRCEKYPPRRFELAVWILWKPVSVVYWRHRWWWLDIFTLTLALNIYFHFTGGCECGFMNEFFWLVASF